MLKVVEYTITFLLVFLFIFGKFQPNYLAEILITYSVVIGIIILSAFFPKNKGVGGNSVLRRRITIVFAAVFLFYNTVTTANVVIDYILNDKQTVVIQLEEDIVFRSGGKSSTNYFIQIRGVEYEIVRPFVPAEFKVKGHTYEITILNGSKKIVQFDKKS